MANSSLSNLIEEAGKWLPVTTPEVDYSGFTGQELSLEKIYNRALRQLKKFVDTPYEYYNRYNIFPFVFGIRYKVICENSKEIVIKFDSITTEYGSIRFNYYREGLEGLFYITSFSNNTFIPLEFPYKFNKGYINISNNEFYFEDVGEGYIQVRFINSDRKHVKMTWEEYQNSRYAWGLRETSTDTSEDTYVGSTPITSSDYAVAYGYDSKISMSAVCYNPYMGYDESIGMSQEQIRKKKELEELERSKKEALEAERLKEEQMKKESYKKRYDEEYAKVEILEGFFKGYSEDNLNIVKQAIVEHNLKSDSEKTVDIREYGNSIQKAIAELPEVIYQSINITNNKNLIQYFKDLVRLTNKITLKKTFNFFTVEVKDDIHTLIKFFKDNERYVKDQVRTLMFHLERYQGIKENNYEERLDINIDILKYLYDDSKIKSMIESRISSLLVSKNLLKSINQMVDNKITSLEHDIEIINEIIFNMIPSWFLRLAILESKKVKDLDNEVLESLNQNRLDIVKKVKEVI